MEPVYVTLIQIFYYFHYRLHIYSFMELLVTFLSPIYPPRLSYFDLINQHFILYLYIQIHSSSQSQYKYLGCKSQTNIFPYRPNFPSFILWLIYLGQSQIHIHPMKNNVHQKYPIGDNTSWKNIHI